MGKHSKGFFSGLFSGRSSISLPGKHRRGSGTRMQQRAKWGGGGKGSGAGARSNVNARTSMNIFSAGAMTRGNKAATRGRAWK